MSYRNEEEHEAQRQECQSVGIIEWGSQTQEQGEMARKAKASGKEPARTRHYIHWGQGEPECFPFQVPQVRGKGGALRIVARPRPGSRQEGVYGVKEGDIEDAGAELAQYLRDTDVWAFEEIWEIGVGDTSASLPEDLPPGMIDRGAFVLGAKYFGPSSGFTTHRLDSSIA